MRHSISSTHHSWLVLLALAAVALATLACGFEGGAFGSTPTPAGANRVIAPVMSRTTPAMSSPAPAVSSIAPSGTKAIPPSPAGAAPDLTPGSTEAILITSPQSGQGVRGSLQITGLSDPALAQQLNVLVRDAQGTVMATARPAAQVSTGQRSTFSAEVALPLDIPRQTGRVQVYAISPNDNAVTHLTSVEVDLNGDGQVVAVPVDLQTPDAIAVLSPSPGAEVKGVVKVTVATMLGPKIVIEVRDAYNQTVGRVEQNVEQTTGLPAQVMAEVPINVTAAGPGRVLVYAVSARDGATEHLSSVEVNLLP